MNKAQAKQVAQLELMHNLGGYEVNVALGLSAMIRSCMVQKTANELRTLANSWGVMNHPEFRA